MHRRHLKHLKAAKLERQIEQVELRLDELEAARAERTVKPLGEDISEMLEYIPEHFKVIRHLRPKLACACCDKIVQAGAPSRPIARGPWWLR